MCWGKKYDSTWFAESIDAVADAVQTNLIYLRAIQGDLEVNDRNDCGIMIERYQAMHDRILVLKNTCPKSQKTVIDNMRTLMKRVQEDRSVLEVKSFYFDLHGKSSENIFIKADALLKASEAIINDPPKGAKIPTDYECAAGIIKKEQDSSLKKILKVREDKATSLKLFEKIKTILKTYEKDLMQEQQKLDEIKSEINETKKKVLESYEAQKSGVIESFEFDYIASSAKIRIETQSAQYEQIESNLKVRKKIYANCFSAWEKEQQTFEVCLSDTSHLFEEYGDLIVSCLQDFVLVFSSTLGKENVLQESFSFDRLKNSLEKLREIIRKDVENQVRLMENIIISDNTPSQSLVEWAERLKEGNSTSEGKGSIMSPSKTAQENKTEPAAEKKSTGGFPSAILAEIEKRRNQKS